MNREVWGSQILPFLYSVSYKYSLFSLFLSDPGPLSPSITPALGALDTHTRTKGAQQERDASIEKVNALTSCVTREEESIGHLKHWRICVCLSLCVWREVVCVGGGTGRLISGRMSVWRWSRSPVLELRQETSFTSTTRTTRRRRCLCQK